MQDLITAADSSHINKPRNPSRVIYSCQNHMLALHAIGSCTMASKHSWRACMLASSLCFAYKLRFLNYRSNSDLNFMWVLSSSNISVDAIHDVACAASWKREIRVWESTYLMFNIILCMSFAHGIAIKYIVHAWIPIGGHCSYKPQLTDPETTVYTSMRWHAAAWGFFHFNTKPVIRWHMNAVGARQYMYECSWREGTLAHMFIVPFWRS